MGEESIVMSLGWGKRVREVWNGSLDVSGEPCFITACVDDCDFQIPTAPPLYLVR